MKKKFITTIAVTLAATILGGCAAMPTASAEDFTKESNVSTQEISIFEPENTLLESVQDAIVPDTQDDTVQASEDAAQEESKEVDRDFSVGDLVETYCVYDNSQYIDTAEMRFDFLVGTLQEVESVCGAK